MKKFKIALLLILLAAAAWRPLQASKATLIRSVVATAMNSLVAAQRPEVGVRSGKATSHQNQPCKSGKKLLFQT